MNRWITAVLIALAVWSSVALVAIPRHVDPSQLPEEKPLPMALLELYLSLFTHIEKLSLENATELLKHIERSYVPPELRYIATRFNQLLRELVDKINATRIQLDEARRRLLLGDVESTHRVLDRARMILAEAWAVYSDLRDATRQLARLGLPVSAVEQGLKRCENALNSLEQEMKLLLREVRERFLERTLLSIEVEPRNITVGDIVEVRGCLETEAGKHLSEREVLIHIANSVTKVETGLDGCFLYRAPVTIYIHRVPVYAEYIPRGLDVYFYTYTRSDTVYLNVDFVETPLRLHLDRDRVLPGSELRLYIETVPNTTLRIGMPFTKAMRTVKNVSGNLTITIPVPTTAREGTYTITVEALPHGVYGPAKSSTRFVVYRLEPRIRVDTPLAMFTGLTLPITISAEPRSRIVVAVPSLGIENTTYGGEVELGIPVPITVLSSELRVYVAVYPLDPRYRPVEIEKSVKLYSSPCIATAIAIATPIVVLALHRKGQRAVEAVQSEEIEIEEMEKRSATHRVLDPIISLFLTALQFLARIAGRAIERHETLREYLAYLKTRIRDGVIHVVEEVFRSIERYLYGNPATVTDSFRQALASMIRRLIEGLRRVVT